MATHDLRGDSSSLLRGINSRLYVREEGAYGEPYADSLSFENYHLALIPGSVITQEQSLIPVNAFTGDKSYFPHEFGKKTTGGIYGFYLNNQTLSKILLHALGNPRSSQLDFSEDRKEFLDNGLGFLQVVDGDTDDTGYVSYFSGNRIGSLTLTCPSTDSLIQVMFSFLGQKASFDYKRQTNPNIGNIPNIVEKVFPSWNSRFVLSKDNTNCVLSFLDFTFTVNNNPIVVDYLDGTNEIQAIQLGRRNITGSFTLPLVDKNSDHNTIQYINDYFNKETLELTFSCYTEQYVEGESAETDEYINTSKPASYSFPFDTFHVVFPKVIFSADTVPRTINEGIIGFDVEFTAYPPQPGYSEVEYYVGIGEEE